MLANVGDEARKIIVSFDEKAPWDALVVRFLQHCGPPDILAGVYSMLEDAHNEETERTLQQRFQRLVFSWQRAQSTYYGVFPERDTRGLRRPPHFCSPFIPTSQQHAELKGLLTGADPGLWHHYCNASDRRHQDNPVILLQYFFGLHNKARRTPVKPPAQTYLRTGPARSTQAFTTSGDGVMTTIPVTAARTLDKRAAASDTMIEATRLAYEAGRITGANSAIHRWCLAATINKADIIQQLADHACYFCGANVESAGIIVHSFW